MKKVLVTIAIVFAMSFGVTKAQEYSRAISVDPLDFLISKVFNATYEHKLSPTNSFTIFASYYSYSDWWSAYGIGGSYRWYLTELLNDNTTPIGGLSVGPMAKISFWSFDGPTYWTYDGGTSIIIGAEAAYKYNFADNWFVEPIVRLGFAVTDLDGLAYDPMGGGLNIGYSW